MKTHLSLVILIFITFPIFANNPYLYAPPETTGKISGTVKDGNQNKAIEYVNVVLYNKSDSLMVTGSLTDVNGQFFIEKVPPGEYYLEIDFIGYKKKIIQDVSLEKGKKDVDIGEVILQQTSISLDEAVVTADKNYIDYKIDKKVVNVSQHANAAGGTVADVLENVPSVNVDIEGNVTLRGSSQFTVLIDGKPTVISGSDMLKQIPANTVENIEIITNPSAKYDPEGTTGIINIIMKKGYSEGLNGMVSANYATWDKVGGELTLNYRKKKINYFVIGNYRRYPRHATSENNRETYFSDTTGFVFENTIRKRVMRPFRINPGFDLYLNDKNTLTVSGTFGGWGMDRIFETEYESFTNPETTHNYSISNNDFVIDGIYYVGNINYQSIFSEKDKEHKLDFNFMVWQWNSDNTEKSFEQTTDNNFNPTGFLSHTRSENKVDRTNYQIKADYTLPVKIGKIEAGAEARLMDQVSDFLYENINPGTGGWEINDAFTNKMDFYRNLYSAYATFSSSVIGLNYQLGLRSEITDRKMTQIITGVEYPVELFKFYPSLHISHDLTKTQQIQISYSRRINRPQPWQMNPVPGYSDSYNYFQGNPLLEPEDTDAYELNYINRMEKLTLSTGLYYRKTSNSLDLVQDIKPEEPNIVYLTYGNVDNTKSLGLELMLNYSPAKIVNINLSGNLYHYEMNSGFYGEEANRTSTNMDGRLNASVNITKSTKVQFVAVYYGPSVRAQGTSEPLYYFDLAVRQSFMKRKLNLSLQGHNIFGTGVFENELKNDQFYSWFYYVGEPAVVRLNISYMINNYERKRRANADIGAGAS
ncbi:MAG: TonB-dependent receptor family protein [Bacteroidales bacterium]|nr:TonB-dependent receptor family protein [Bacteroidales bacterium]